MSPGMGAMKRRLEKERDAVSLAVSGVAKMHGADPAGISTLETKYDSDAGDWYVALGWGDQRVIVRMDSVQGTITDVRKI